MCQHPWWLPTSLHAYLLRLLSQCLAVQILLPLDSMQKGEEGATDDSGSWLGP